MTDETAPASAGATESTTVSPETEAHAREGGWVPLAEFKKHPNDWVSADDFVKRFDDPTYLRKKMREAEKASDVTTQKLAKQIAAQEEAFKSRLDRMGKASARALEIQRERIYAEIEAKKEAAVEDGDTAKYKALKAHELETRKEFAKEDAELAEEPAPKKVGGAQHPDYSQEVADWWSENPTFFVDKENRQYVEFLWEQATVKGIKEISGRLKFIDAGLVKAGLKKGVEAQDVSIPEPRMPSVEGGARVTNGVRKKGWSDIPAEEKAIYARHIKEGLYKDQAEAASTHWE